MCNKVKFDQMSGRTVKVRQILTIKPQMSDVPGWGYIIDEAEYDIDQREDCFAVGQLSSWYRDGIAVVCFITPNWHSIPDYQTTMAFAHIDDIEPTEDDYVFPLNEGLVMQ